MAKKTIISDFSALKGKVTFSEKKDDVKASPKVTSAPTPKPRVSEDGLKVGQSVVLMDSNLRGKIIGLGKKVKIELADGLVIESAYGEFAVTDKGEIASLKETKVKAKKTNMGSKRSTPMNPDGSLTIDLHIEAIPGGVNVPKGQQLQFQMDTFRRVIRENANRRGMKITFIHGIGDGILKAAIRKELDEVLALRCSYSVGDPAVTIVSIK
jgi:hypothetical protein